MPYRAHGALPLAGGDIHSAIPIGGAINPHTTVALTVMEIKVFFTSVINSNLNIAGGPPE